MKTKMPTTASQAAPQPTPATPAEAEKTSAQTTQRAAQPPAPDFSRRADARPSWLEIDLDAIGDNVRAAKSVMPVGSSLFAVVKANAYGHGMLPVARASLAAGAEWLAVALAPEGVALREAGIQAPILVLGWTPADFAAEAIRRDVSLTIASADDIAPLARVAEQVGRRARVHVKVDTGMSRLGMFPDDEGLEALRALTRESRLRWDGTFTHFASADEPDLGHAQRQLARFKSFLQRLRDAGLNPGLVHACNTAGILRMPEAHFDAGRLGLGLYGYYPSTYVPKTARLRPALAWKARLATVKHVAAGETVSYAGTYQLPEDEWIGTVPVGYADGFLRALGNCGRSLVAGRERPVRGRICMDQYMLGLGPANDEAPARRGDEVVLLGKQGEAAVSADDLGDWADTNAYNVLATLAPRVPRIYTGNGRGEGHS